MQCSLVYDLEKAMIQMYSGRIIFLDGELSISLPFAIQAKSIQQAFELLKIKYEIHENQIFDLKITNRKALKDHKESSLQKYKESLLK